MSNKLTTNETGVIKYAYSLAVTAGVPIFVAGIGILIAIASAAANAAATYYKEGVFKFTVSNAAVVVVGDLVYYHPSTNTVNTTPATGCYPLGTALSGGTGNATGTVLVEVQINEFGTKTLESVVTLTNAQVKTLNATPVSVIAAPGAGKFIFVDEVLGKLNYATAAFDAVAAGDDFTLKYTDASGGIAAQLETTGWLDASADAYQLGRPAVSVKPVVNAAIVANILTGEVFGAAGGGSVTLHIKYRVVKAI